MIKIIITLALCVLCSTTAMYGSNDVEQLRFRESGIKKTTLHFTSSESPDEQCLDINTTVHKYYLSVSNVKYNPSVGALQMTTRFFIDDLEDVLTVREKKEIILTENGRLDEYKSLIARYVKSKMRVKIDHDLKTADYLGAEVDGDQLVLYIEIPVTQEPSHVEMRFTALFELFEDQKNMVHFKLKGKRKTLLMTIDKKTDSVKF